MGFSDNNSNNNKTTKEATSYINIRGVKDAQGNVHELQRNLGKGQQRFTSIALHADMFALDRNIDAKFANQEEVEMTFVVSVNRPKGIEKDDGAEIEF